MRDAIRPRRVTFGWKQTPLHWIPDEPTTTHVTGALHLLQPAWSPLVAAITRCLRRPYHPFQEGSPRKAVAYLAISPAARGRRPAAGPGGGLLTTEQRDRGVTRGVTA